MAEIGQAGHAASKEACGSMAVGNLPDADEQRRGLGLPEETARQVWW